MDIFSKVATVDYCEKALDSIIARPGYAISNFAFIIVGIYLIVKNRRSKLSTLFGSLSILIGVCSFLYDASAKFFFQYFDWLGMFLFILFLCAINIKRIFNLGNQKLGIFYVITLLIYLLLSFISEQGVVAFALGVVFVILSEIFLVLKRKQKFSEEWLAALVLFIAGFISRNLDLYHLVCDPTNILNGRGVFHYLASISILLLHRHYKRILGR